MKKERRDLVDQGAQYEEKMLQIVRLEKEKNQEMVLRVSDVLKLGKDVYEET